MDMGVASISVVTGRAEDVEDLRKHVEDFESTKNLNISVHADKASHRGTAGALKDFMDARPNFDDVIFIEGNRVPPEYPEKIFCDEFESEEVIGVLGKTSLDETAGMVLIKKKMLDVVPSMGFFDFKEQLIPRVLDLGFRILVKEITRRSIRLSTPSAYLEQLIEFTPSRDDDVSGPFVSDSARIDPEAILGKNVIVGDGVTIGAGCLVQDSVILEGSKIGAGSTLIRSIITSNSKLENGTSSIITPHELDAHQPPVKRRAM